MSKTAGISAAGRAFTLVEAIVVMVIIGILATAIVPRFLDSGSRVADEEATEVRRLIGVAGEFTSSSAQPVAIEYDAAQRRLWLSVQVAKTGAASVDTPTATWQAAPLVAPVDFKQLQVVSASADGIGLNKSHWRVIFAPGVSRPEVRLTLGPSIGGGTADDRRVVVLPSVGIEAWVEQNGTNGKLAGGVRSIDLDDAGMGAKTW